MRMLDVSLLAGELVVSAGCEGHVPHISRAAGVPHKMPSVGSQEKGSGRSPAVGREMRVSGAASFPQRGHRVKPGQM